MPITHGRAGIFPITLVRGGIFQNFVWEGGMPITHGRVGIFFITMVRVGNWKSVCGRRNARNPCTVCAHQL